MHLTLETKNLILRPFDSNDAQKMYENWACDTEVTKFLTWDAHKSVDITQSIINTWIQQYEKPERINCAITLKENNELIGGIDVVGYLDDIPVIGYCLSRKYWNKGYMSQACLALLNYLFKIGHKRVIIDAVDENIGSNKVIIKCHGKLQGQYKDEFKNKNKTFIINRYYVEPTSIYITAGQYMYDFFKGSSTIYVPFNEAMIEGVIDDSPIFSDKFINNRAITHNTTVDDYLDKMGLFINFINHIYLYNDINLMFGDEPFCLANLITILSFLESIKYNGKITYHIMNEQDNTIVKSIPLSMGKWKDIYNKIRKLNKGEKEKILIKLF